MTNEKKLEMVKKYGDISGVIHTKMDQVYDFLIQANKQLKEFDYFFNKCSDYVNLPNNYGKNAPVAAWRGIIPVQKEIDRSIEICMKAVQESRELLPKMCALGDKLSLYTTKLKTYYAETDKTHKKMDKAKSAGTISQQSPIYKKSIADLAKMPSYNSEIDAILSFVTIYKESLKSIKIKINILKGAN